MASLVLGSDLITSIIFMAVGLVLYIIGKTEPIQPAVNKVMWIIGLILLVIGIILFLIWAITFAFA